MIIWLKRNMFRSVGDSIISIAVAAVAGWVVWQLLQFIFITGRWEIIQVNLKLLLVGRFPEELMWMLGASILALSFWIGAVASSSKRDLNNRTGLIKTGFGLLSRFGLIIALGAIIIALAGTLDAVLLGIGTVAAIALGRLVGLARRKIAVLAKIPWLVWQILLVALPLVMIIQTLLVSDLSEWGGFLINVYIAILSIALAFPLGVFLALGRRSSLPIVRLVCTSYIELVRGAPLFVLLLLAGVALEFFIPSEIAPGAIFRAVTVFTMFTAAYLAEIIRGGLQSISKGQTEAGKALGLSTVKIIFLITLPQALRNVIPAQIGQFISLFKDTTLAGAALSMLELLKVGEAITKQDDYLGQGLVYESLGFVALLFWVGSYVMSRESQRLERKLGVGIR
ncbi:MAG: amino acid ABC transporter permease [Aquiluna sp.]|nr:amino acid ABC transporter permease [Aquiluna sp.]